MDGNFFDDSMMWLMLIAIAIACVLFFYVGVTGMAALTSTHDTWAKSTFAISGYLMFLLLPLMILSLALDNIIINTLLEWSTNILMIAVVADIILLTVTYVLAFWIYG